MLTSRVSELVGTVLDLAKAERIPDVRVEALYHRLEAQKENTFDIGLSIPLPLFNRNQGRPREARAEAAVAEARARSTQLGLSVRLHEAHSIPRDGLSERREPSHVQFSNAAGTSRKAFAACHPD